MSPLVELRGFEPLTPSMRTRSLRRPNLDLDCRVSGAYDCNMARSAARHESIGKDEASLRAARSDGRRPAVAGLYSAQTELRPERLAYTVEEAALVVGVGRDLLYDEIRTGRLRSKKAGSRRVIARHHLLEWLDSDQGAA